jgi:hypothetical protein
VSTFKKSGAKMCQLLRKVEQKCLSFSYNVEQKCVSFSYNVEQKVGAKCVGF